MNECIRCHRTAAELGANREAGFAQLLTRRRPLLKRESTYQVCFGCARAIREEQDERAQDAIKQAERAGA